MGTAFAKFGNVKWTCGWSLDYQGGQSPSVCTINTVPHLDYLERRGDLIIGEEGRGYLTLRDCKLLSPSFTSGRKWELPILDRRWKWAYGYIDGSYNIRRPDKTYIREKTPQQLAELLLEAMGERRGNWDVSRLPNYARPEVSWSSANPASMFDDLVTSFGCTWTLDYFADRVVVWPIGQGINLPEADTQSRQYGLSSVAKPDKIRVVGSRVLFQARFATEAVGKDTDGKIKPLAKITGYDVSAIDDIEKLNDIDKDSTYDDNGETRKVRELAKQWLYRAYRVTGLADGGWCPKALYGSNNAPASFFDFEFVDSRAEQEIDENDIGQDGASTGRKVNKPILVMGRWYDSENDATPASGELRRYDGHVSFDGKLGVVKFGDPVYLVDSNSRPSAATVYVDVAFYAGKDGVFSRPFVEWNTGESNGTGPRVIIRSEIENRQIHHYDKTTMKSVEVLPADVYDQLDYYAKAALDEYAETPTLTRTYYGLLPIVPDGRIRQVTWQGGDGNGPSTIVSVGTAHNPYLPSVEDNRRKQAITDLLKIPAWQRTAADRKALTTQLSR